MMVQVRHECRCCLCAQVVRCRHACMPPNEPPRELTPAERQQLHLLHVRRQAEIASKQCAAVLRHVQAHKVALSSIICCASRPAPAPSGCCMQHPVAGAMNEVRG